MIPQYLNTSTPIDQPLERFSNDTGGTGIECRPEYGKWMAGDAERTAKLLAAARAGDSAAFQHLVDPFRAELQAHCYRMLGSTEDAKYSMPPEPEWYFGREAIRAFLADGPLTMQWRIRPAHANGQLTFGTYMWNPEKNAYIPAGLDLLALRGDKIAEVVSFLTAGFGMFGLPEEISN
jgi:hypothetical protein